MCRITRGLSSLVALVLLAQVVVAQSPSRDIVPEDLPKAEKLIECSLKLMGGREELMKLRSRVTKGTITIRQAGLTGKMTFYQQRDGKAALIINIPTVGVQKLVSDGEIIWEISPSGDARVLKGERERQARLELELVPLLNYDEYFDSIACTGKDRSPSTGGRTYSSFVVTSRKDEDKPVLDYFAEEDGRYRGRVMELQTPVGRKEVRIGYADYKRVSGYSFPHKINSGAYPLTQEVLVEEMKINAEIPGKVFEMPDQVARLLENK